MLGMWAPIVSSCLGWKDGKGSRPGAGVSLSAKPFSDASLRLSGEGSTCRIVERVLYAVPGRSGEAGTVRGMIWVALMLSPLSVNADSAGGASNGSLSVEPVGYGGNGDSVGEEKFWRMAKRNCKC